MMDRRFGTSQVCSLNIPTSTARRTRSSSQSIRSLREGAILRVAPELSDPVGSLEVGEHQDVEQLGAGSRTEGVEALPELSFEVLRFHVQPAREAAQVHLSTGPRP
mgnify:CR=1 FL=1